MADAKYTLPELKLVRFSRHRDEKQTELEYLLSSEYRLKLLIGRAKGLPK